MKRTVLALIVASSMAVPATSAHATITIYRAELSGLQEVPTPNQSPATGFAVVTINDVAETMRVESAFSGLLGTTTAAHIHCCAPAGSVAGVATTTPTFPGFPGGLSKRGI